MLPTVNDDSIKIVNYSAEVSGRIDGVAAMTNLVPAADRRTPGGWGGRGASCTGRGNAWGAIVACVVGASSGASRGWLGGRGGADGADPPCACDQSFDTAGDGSVVDANGESGEGAFGRTDGRSNGRAGQWQRGRGCRAAATGVDGCEARHDVDPAATNRKGVDARTARIGRGDRAAVVEPRDVGGVAVVGIAVAGRQHAARGRGDAADSVSALRARGLGLGQAGVGVWPVSQLSLGRAVSVGWASADAGRSASAVWR